MLRYRFGFVTPALVAGCLLASVGGVSAAGPDINAAPEPNQLDVLQGTAVRLGGTPSPGGPQPDSYDWEIVLGEGGALFDADQPTAIFQAPVIENDLAVFVIRLLVTYPDGQTGSSTVHIRVHRSLDEPEAEPEESIEDIMTDFYRRESEQRERRKQRERENRPVVVQQSFSYGFGYPGFGWGAGWPVVHPVPAPIVIPPPGVDWGAVEIEWPEPAIVDEVEPPRP